MLLLLAASLQGRHDHCLKTFRICVVQGLVCRDRAHDVTRCNAMVPRPIPNVPTLPALHILEGRFGDNGIAAGPCLMQWKQPTMTICFLEIMYRIWKVSPLANAQQSRFCKAAPSEAKMHPLFCNVFSRKFVNEGNKITVS